MSWVRERGLFVAALAALVLVLSPTVRSDDTPAAGAAPEVPQPLLLEYLADHSRFTLLDARSPAEYHTSHIAGAVNVPFDAIAGKEGLLPADHDALIVVYCRTGRRAGKLRDQLVELGYTDVRVLRPEQYVLTD
jgi:phage shock protein E